MSTTLFSCNIHNCPRTGEPNTSGVNFFSGTRSHVFYCAFHTAKNEAYRESRMSYAEWHKKHAKAFRAKWLADHPEDADVIDADRAQHADLE